MCDITTDIVQWLLMDEKVIKDESKTECNQRFQVVSKWRSLAWRLGLVEFIVDIDCWRGGGRIRRRGREKDKLEMLLRMWKERKPDTYNIRMLKTVLAAEVNVMSVNMNVKWLHTLNCRDWLTCGCG